MPVIGISGGDLKILPANGIELILPLHTADSLVVDQDPFATKLPAQTAITVAWKFFLDPLDVVFELGVTAGLIFGIALGLIIIAARCQVHDLGPLGNRGKLSAVITEVLTLLCRRSQSPSFFKCSTSR